MEQKTLPRARRKLKKFIKKEKLEKRKIRIFFKTLTPEQAIGRPARQDYPIIKGEEKVIQAVFENSKAHVFTDAPVDFSGTVEEIINLSPDSNRHRAIFLATLNVILKYKGIIENTLHCKDEEPENCAGEIARHILEKHGKITVGLIGLNPAILEELVSVFGKKNVKVTDLDKKNICKNKFGVKVMDGSKSTLKLVKESNLVLLTGTTLVNGTFEHIYNRIKKHDKNYIIYGVTCAGVCQLLGLNRLCFYGKS